MTTSIEAPKARGVSLSQDAFTVELDDGRFLTVPLSWYPRLLNGTAEERQDWSLIGRGEAIHWERLDEDISVEGLLAGRRSMESQRSFARWLAGRGS
jgi:hypothetical protein